MSGIFISDSGHWVRVYHDENQTYFNFKEYGSAGSALKAALAFEAKLSVKSRYQKMKPKINAKGASGFTGVGKYIAKRKWRGWVAYYQTGKQGNRKQKVCRFTFSAYGAHALEAAIQWRKLMIEHTFDDLR